MTLTRQDFIPIPPGKGRGFDHADVFDGARSSGQRIYVAHTGADRIEVIDCQTNRYARSLTDLPGVAGVLIDSQQDLLFSSDRGCARVSVFRPSDEQLLGRVAVGSHPNGLAYDAKRRRLYVFNLGEPPGVNCTASVVAVDDMRVVATIPLAGRPRWAMYDPDADRILANVQSPATIAIIDAESMEITGAFDVPSEGPHGMGIDGDSVFCAADGLALVVLNRVNGDMIASRPLPGVPDVVMVDPGLDRLYVAIGEPGVVCVFDTRTLALLETVATERGAHTIGVNPALHTLYAFLPDSRGAAVLVDSR